MLGPAVNRQPGYRRKGLVELETIPNDFSMMDLRLMWHRKRFKSDPLFQEMSSNKDQQLAQLT